MSLYALADVAPIVAEDAWVAPGCYVIGNVALESKSSIWFGSTLRGDNERITIGATILNGAKIGKNCLIGAGALITEGKDIPDGSLVMGVPGKVIRTLDAAGIASLELSALHYQENAARFRAELRKL